jgi:membrane protease YdiL (CAAX protease family)
MSFPHPIQLAPYPKVDVATQTTEDLAQLPPKATPSKWSFIERGLKYFGAGAAASVICSKITPRFMLSGNDWCPVLPKEVYSFARSLCLSRDYIPVFKGGFDTLAFKSPIHEELVFRFGMQHILLKQLPKALSNRFTHVVDSTAAKVARVIVTAGAFSLAHANPPVMDWPNCSTARLVNTFALGLILGGVQEATESPLLCMLTHSGMNLMTAFLSEYAPVAMVCPPEYF